MTKKQLERQLRETRREVRGMKRSMRSMEKSLACMMLAQAFGEDMGDGTYALAGEVGVG